jgi:hypothetical protein
MPDYASLDPETRCYALVGQYLYRITLLETCINAAIQTAIRVTDLMRFILCANITIRVKIAILRSLLSASNLTDSERQHYDSVLINISDDVLSNRNMIAHEQFRPDREGIGVEFLRVKSKKDLSLPSEVWLVPDFKRECAKVESLSNEIARLMERFKTAQFDDSKVTRIITVTPRPEAAPTDHKLTHFSS